MKKYFAIRLFILKGSNNSSCRINTILGYHSPTDLQMIYIRYMEDKGSQTSLQSSLNRYQPMTQKQIRDLQQFAVELAREGNTKAAKEVLALINKAA